jgi:hypothetical protein
MDPLESPWADEHPIVQLIAWVTVIALIPMTLAVIEAIASRCRSNRPGVRDEGSNLAWPGDDRHDNASPPAHRWRGWRGSDADRNRDRRSPR